MAAFGSIFRNSETFAITKGGNYPRLPFKVVVCSIVDQTIERLSAGWVGQIPIGLYSLSIGGPSEQMQIPLCGTRVKVFLDETFIRAKFYLTNVSLSIYRERDVVSLRELPRNLQKLTLTDEGTA